MFYIKHLKHHSPVVNKKKHIDRGIFLEVHVKK